jgi:hypothetical protein
MSKPDELAAYVKECTDDRNMFSFSGPIYPEQVNKFISFALHRKKSPSLSLIITTYGGDAHSAYRLARFLQEFFPKKRRVLIVGQCKSAGTLVTISANELAFGPFGELGPLDVQVTKKDEIIPIASGLDTFQSLAIIQTYAFNAFEEYMLNLVEGSHGSISTRMACEIACSLVTGLFQPLMAQLDPQRLGEMQRMMSIANAYGQRLDTRNLKAGSLAKLIEGYPAHPFSIDYREARVLFKNVSKMTKAEAHVVHQLEENGACLSRPSDDSVFHDVSDLLSSGGEGGENEASERGTPSTGSDDPGSSGNTGAPEEPRPAKSGSARRKRPKPT